MTLSPPPFSDVLEPIVAATRQHGLVVFAGAGISIASPSALPNWRTMNDAFLDALCMRLAEFTDGAAGGPQLCEWLAQRRDERNVISPDFQAQLAEDECGGDYFRVFQPLDIDAWNKGHAALAALAGAGVLRAIVTTNFDRLIEHALRAAHIEFRVQREIVEFEELSKLVENASPQAPLLLVKAHGCISSPQSMVDTLRQRVAGRPAALERSITTLVSRHATLVVGFSGADLADRPRYLGLAEGVRNSPLFVVLNREGQEPRRELVELAGHAAGHARIVDGESPRDLVWLARAFEFRSLVEPKWDIEMESPGLRAHMLRSQVFITWGQKLDGVSAANVLATLVEAAGADTRAFELLATTWKHVSHPQQRSDAAFLRYLTLFGRQLIEHALLGPSAQALDADPAKTGATALELLAFAAADPKRVDALAEAARAAYFSGAPKHALTLARLVPERLEAANPLLAIDACLAASQVERNAGDVSNALALLERAHALALELGDEPSRARVCAQLGRCLGAVERFDEGAERLDEAALAVRRLQHAQLGLDVSAARGAFELRRGRHDDAVGYLAIACDGYHKTQRLARYGEALTSMLFAARLAKNEAWIAQATAHIEQLVPRLPVLELEFRLWYVAAYFDAEQFEQARNAARYVRALASRMDHTRMLERLAPLEKLLPPE